MAEIKSETEIDAPPPTVWTVLTTFLEYEYWNPFIVRVIGTANEGNANEVVMVPPEGREERFAPIVTELQPNRRMVWESGMPLLFKRRITFEIEDLGGNRSRFVQSGKFTGALTAFKGSMIKSLEAGYGQMTDALKKRAESLVN